MPFTKIRSNVPVIKVLDIHQRRRPEESCDTHIICEDGYIPCHRFVLMANSSFLNHLILDNIKDMGHMDAKAIISLSFPGVKTPQMAQVISMFYTGKAVLPLKDVWYVMGIMKLFGNEVSSAAPATEEEIAGHYKIRYFIDAESDSEDDDGSRFTTNAFVALQQQSQASSTSGQDEQPTTSKDVLLKKSNTDEQGAKKDDEKVDVPNEKVVSTEQNPSASDVDDPEESAPPTTDPKVTPINMKSLIRRKNLKRGRPSNKEANSKKEKNTVKQVSKDSKTDKADKDNSKTDAASNPKSKTSVKPKKKSTNEKSDKKKTEEESDSDYEFDSDDSALEIITVRKLRKRTPQQASNSNEGLRTTPLRSCRKLTDAKLQATVKVEPKDAEEGDSNEEDSIQYAEVKCYFCSSIFANEKLLGVHLSRNCGKHLSDKYSISSKKCYLCHNRFPTLNLWGLIRHVNTCNQARKGKKNEVKSKPGRKIEASKKVSSNTNDDNESIKTTRLISADKAKNMDSEDEVDSDEVMSVVDSLKVKVLYTQDDLIHKTNSDIVTNTDPLADSMTEMMDTGENEITVESLIEEIDNDIREFNKQAEFSKRNPPVLEEVSTVAVVPSVTGLLNHENDPKFGECSQSSSNVLQIFDPPPPILIPQTRVKIPFNPAQVAERFRQVLNKDNKSKQSNNMIQFDANKPSTSKAALANMAMMCHKNRILPDPLSFPVPKIPALSQHSSKAKKSNEVSIGLPEKTTTYVPFVRNPLPGDRLYCGTVTLENQGYRLFKTNTDSDDNPSSSDKSQMLCLPGSTDAVSEVDGQQK